MHPHTEPSKSASPRAPHAIALLGTLGLLLLLFIAPHGEAAHAEMPANWWLGVLPFAMLVFLTVFEVLVGFLQAYIFTTLTAVYINMASHAEH